jgi:hypothetical protein
VLPASLTDEGDPGEASGLSYRECRLHLRKERSIEYLHRSEPNHGHLIFTRHGKNENAYLLITHLLIKGRKWIQRPTEGVARSLGGISPWPAAIRGRCLVDGGAGGHQRFVAVVESRVMLLRVQRRC